MKKKMKGKPRKGSPQFSQRQRDVESMDMRKDIPNKYQRHDDREVHKSTPNDWRWYARSPEMVKAYASFPFGEATGMPIRLDVPFISNNSVPGVMVVGFAPAIGADGGETAAVNVAMRQLYSDIRHKNSGAANYEAPDLMCYILGMGSIYTYVAWLRRVYGLMLAYSQTNRYIPKYLLQAMGVDYDDVQQHLADLAGYINLLSAKVAGSLCVPNGMAYMARHAWMVSGVFMDSTTTKAQYYLYNPDYYYKLNVTGTPAVTSLQYVSSPFRANGTLKKFSAMVTFGDELFNAVITNEDFNIMSGDILKAYGLGGVVTLPAMSQDYMVLPTYSPEVLSQIENSTSMTLTLTTGSGVTQDTSIGGGYLKPAYNVLATMWDRQKGLAMSATLKNAVDTALSGRKLVNFHNDGVTPEQMIVATRLNTLFNVMTVNMPTVDGAPITMNLSVKACGSEFVTSTYIGMLSYYPTAGALTFIPINYVAGNVKAVSLAQRMLFDWAPLSIVLNDEVSGSNLNISGATITGEIDNYTYVDAVGIQNMHSMSLLSELWAPVGNSTI